MMGLYENLTDDTVCHVLQVMKSMPRIDESRKRKAEGGPPYGKKSKTDPTVPNYFY